MQVHTFYPNYTAPRRHYNQEEGQRIRIRHDILDAAETRCPNGMTLKAYINQVLTEHFL